MCTRAEPADRELGSPRLASRRRSFAVALVVACAGGLCAAPPAAARALAAPTPLTGAYVGPANPAALTRFDRTMGVRGQVAADYLAWDTWEDIVRPTWWLRRWRTTARRKTMVYGVPLLPRTGGTLADGAAGAYDARFRRLARLLVIHGQGDATLRLGWEFNGGNRDPWYVGTAPQGPEWFAAYWRRVVRAMRGVRGGRFRFDFSVSPGPGGALAERAWPGRAYVDYVGVDLYDQSWAAGGGPIASPPARWRWLLRQDHGLLFWARFAARHGRALSLPEWGLRGGPNGAGDDPYFVARVWSWTRQHRVAYEVYFNATSSALTPATYPRSYATYRRLWRSPRISSR